MDECWCAFALALMSHEYLTPETAFVLMNKGKTKENVRRAHNELTVQDIHDMVRMKEIMTYKQIGAIFGMTADAIYNRIRRFRSAEEGGIKI